MEKRAAWAALCVLLLSPLIAVDGIGDWKPLLDLSLSEESTKNVPSADLGQEFQFPTDSTHEPKLYDLDQELPVPKSEPAPILPLEEKKPEPLAPAVLPSPPPNVLQEPLIPPSTPQESLPIPQPTQTLSTPATPAATSTPIQLNSPESSSTQNPSSAASLDTGRGILINFNNVGIIEFIRFISRASNKNFIFDEGDLQFNVTIVSEEPTSMPNILTALMQVLRVHGLSLIEQGNNILIHNNKAVTQVSKLVAEETIPLELESRSEIVTRVFRLNTLDPEKAAVIIQPLISEGALVEVLKETGHLIVTDLSTNVVKIGQLLKSLDAPNSGLSIGQYVVVNALLDSLINLAQQVMEPIAEGRPLVFVAHAPSNSVFIVSTPFIVDRALGVLRTLDINVGETRILPPDALRFSKTPQEKQGVGPGGVRLGPHGRPIGPDGKELEEGQGGVTGTSGVLESSSPWTADLPSGHIERIKFYIHKLHYRKGEQIVDALSRVAASLQESGTGNLDLISSIQSIQWLEASNSLVFTGTVNSIGKVKELIDEIDTPLRQVFIEMLILDTTLDDSLKYGVDWASRFNNKGNTAGSQAFLGTVNTLASALDTATPGTSLNPNALARDFGYKLGIIGRNITHCGLSFDSIGALVSALHDKSKVEIVMNPKILVEDNAPAEIFVGINTAFQTQAISNDQGSIITNNFEFRDVGTRLKVTPLISNNDIITMDIVEEVSSVDNNAITTTGALNSTSPGPTTRINKTTTRVHVPNNFFLVMSGMIQDEHDRRRTQVPCLGGAPLIGALFSQKTLVENKRNLMIFIHPLIIDSEEDIDNVTRHNQDIFREKIRTKKMWKYEVEEALDMLNVKESDVSLHDTEQYNP